WIYIWKTDQDKAFTVALPCTPQAEARVFLSKRQTSIGLGSVCESEIEPITLFCKSPGAAFLESVNPKEEEGGGVNKHQLDLVASSPFLGRLISFRISEIMAIAAPGQLNLNEVPSWGSRSVDCFEKLEQIGEGTYGQVYMAREIKTGEIFPITAIREIKILKKLHHENVINLKEIVTSPGPEKDDQDGNKYKGGIYMVFEYMDHDLTGLADRPGMRFSVPQIKCYMRQLLTGLHYCHVNQVLHRDIKGSNLLIDNEGNLKLADFGLARSFSNDHNANLTNRVITLWYRPPELLLGATKYGPAVDMWSVGCIFAELLHGKPIFPGKDEL
ncbi:cyclin-dependent kinase C, partial [Prunus dulcis]